MEFTNGMELRMEGQAREMEALLRQCQAATAAAAAAGQGGRAADGGAADGGAADGGAADGRTTSPPPASAGDFSVHSVHSAAQSGGGSAARGSTQKLSQLQQQIKAYEAEREASRGVSWADEEGGAAEASRGVSWADEEDGAAAAEVKTEVK